MYIEKGRREGGGEIGFYNRLFIFRRPKFCRSAKLASCIVDAKAAGKMVLQPFTLLPLPPTLPAANLYKTSLRVLPSGKTRGRHTSNYLINDALKCPFSTMNLQTCTNRTKRTIRGADGQRKNQFYSLYSSTAALKFPMRETCTNQLYKFCRPTKLGADIRPVIRLTMR